MNNPCEGSNCPASKTLRECNNEGSTTWCHYRAEYFGYQEGLADGKMDGCKAQLEYDNKRIALAEAKVKAREREIVEWLDKQAFPIYGVDELEAWLRKE